MNFALNNPLVLVIDIGNSYTKIAACKDNLVLKKYELLSNDNINVELISQILKNNFIKFQFSGSIIGSVVNKYKKIFINAIKSIFNLKPYLINNHTLYTFKVNKKIQIKNVGDDILALATFCNSLSKDGIGFSFGSSIFGILVVDNEFIGASITMGLTNTVNSLIQNIDLIKKTKINVFNKTPLIGTNTVSALEDGIYHMRNGFVNSFYNSYIQKYKLNSKYLNCVLTGYEANIINANFNYHIERNAILLGYYFIYLFNNV